MFAFMDETAVQDCFGKQDIEAALAFPFHVTHQGTYIFLCHPLVHLTDQLRS
jgi:hypothetical protein